MHCPWWKSIPGRLKNELRELRRAGINYKIDRAEFRKGKLKLDLEVEVDGSRRRLVALFPETFPYFRVDVEAPDLSLPLHQNPFTCSLCLIGRRTENWRISDTLAALITHQFPRVLAAATTADRASTSDLEEDQGEPATTFYSYLKRSAILVDSSWRIPPECLGGWVHLGLRSLRPQFVRGAVLKVCDAARNLLAMADHSVESRYAKKRIWIRWTRHDFVPSDNPAELFDTVASDDPQVSRLRWHRSKGVGLDITGVLMREEVTRIRQADAWVFVLRETGGGSKRRGLPRSDPQRTRLVRAHRAGRNDLAARMPETDFLRTKKATIIGLGCVGATVAVELSKATCGTLALVDSDVAEAGQVVRWPVGFTLIGENKAQGLAAFIGENWPYTNAIAMNMKVGVSIASDESVVAASDLVVDCSAEEGVQRYLAQLCRQRAKTLLIASATQGARGGIVVRFRPNSQELCFRCWELHQADGKIPNPPEDAAGRVQPEGCADPTFTGAAFDAMEVSLMVARTAIGELGGGEPGAYPRAWWNTAVLSLRTNDGQIIPPKWEVLFLRPHPLCKERHH